MRFKTLLAVTSLLVILTAGFTSPAIGQADVAAKDNGVQINVFRTGVGVFDRGEWTVIGLRGTNSREEAVKATVVLYFDKDTQTQYKRTFWIPARSHRMTWMPVKTPDEFEKKSSLSAFTMNFVEGEGEQSGGAQTDIARGADVGLFTETLLPISSRTVQTGIIEAASNPSRPYETWRDVSVGEAVGSMRQAFEAEPATVELREAFLPPYSHSFDSLDNLVISDDRWLDDSAAPIAIRSWIAGGGKVWLMLDKVSQRSVDALLGDDACCEILDRVELTEFTLNTPQLEYAEADPNERWESEVPVDFVRTLLSNEAVVHTRIDDWPAAFSVKQGSGTVLITTLGARGWYHADAKASSTVESASKKHTRALGEIGARMLALRSESGLSADEITPMLESQVGYEVPSRAMAGLLLGANCLVLIGAGIALARFNKLQHIAWILPACCLLTSGIMISIGMSNASSVPPTVASLQLLEIASGSKQVQTSSYVTIYSPKSDEFSLSADHGGLVVSESNELKGTSKSLIWDGAHDSKHEKFQLPPGAARSISIRESYILPQAIRASGQFNEDGFSGQLNGLDQIEGAPDALVAAPLSAGSSVEVRADGSFVCREDQLLAPGEFLTGTLLTDQQQRRQKIMRAIFKPAPSTPYPAQASLFVWSDSELLSIRVPDEYQRRRDSLWAIPLDVRRTPPKSSFVVPATFVRMDRAQGKFGNSIVYNPRTGQWMDNARSGTKSMFRFVLPSQVLPAKLSSATVSLKIHAPSREVQLLGWNTATGEIATIESWQSPSGVHEVEVTDAELLSVAADRSLLLGISVSESTGNDGDDLQRSSSESSTSGTWKASYMRVSVAGTTQ